MTPASIAQLKKERSEVRVAFRLWPQATWEELRRSSWVPSPAVFILWAYARWGGDAYWKLTNAYLEDERGKALVKLSKRLAEESQRQLLVQRQAEQAEINRKVRHVVDWEDRFE